MYTREQESWGKGPTGVVVYFLFPSLDTGQRRVVGLKDPGEFNESGIPEWKSR